MKILRLIFVLFFACQVFHSISQHTRADSLRGKLYPERSCYDVIYYDLNIRIDPERKWIEGYNDIHFKGVHSSPFLQIDLFDNMEITRIERDGEKVLYSREYGAVMIDTPVSGDETHSVLRIYYRGHPLEAEHAPWKGGFVWSGDDHGNPFIGVACEGIGASLWWPNKDHLSDEPDSMRIAVEVQDPLFCVSNGVLVDKKALKGDYTRYIWKVHYPINNYNVTVNIARYHHFQDTYFSSDGDSLDLDYYVLPYNYTKAKAHFEQVGDVLEAYEHYFGKYPFWEDGYCLVEAPYLGMEHQSAIAYGNAYKSGYFGHTLLRDMDWDYIIIHETAHEYWGNAVSVSDHAEMWLHEAFSTYLEVLFVEYHYDFATSIEYLNTLRPFIANEEPVIGPLEVNFDRFSSSDHYMKGAWMLHTFRQSLQNDALFFEVIRSFYENNLYNVVDTEDFMSHVNTTTGEDYRPFFRQFLYEVDIPVFEYHLRDKKKHLEIIYRWQPGLVKDFSMPVFLECRGNQITLTPHGEWQKTEIRNCREKDINIQRDAGLFRTRLVYPED